MEALEDALVLARVDADARASGFARQAVVHAVEALEDALVLARVDADARVAHAKNRRVLFLGKLQLDPPAGGGEFHRVIQQIDQRLPQRERVDERPAFLRHSGDGFGEREAFFLGPWAHEGGGFADERRDVRVVEREGLAPALEAGEIEHVFHQRGEPAAFAADEAVVIRRLRRVRLAALQPLGQRGDAGHGRAEFVRDAGDKFHLQPRQFRLPAKGAPRHPQRERRHRQRRAEQDAQPPHPLRRRGLQRRRIGQHESHPPRCANPGGKGRARRRQNIVPVPLHAHAQALRQQALRAGGGRAHEGGHFREWNGLFHAGIARFDVPAGHRAAGSEVATECFGGDGSVAPYADGVGLNLWADIVKDLQAHERRMLDSRHGRHRSVLRSRSRFV